MFWALPNEITPWQWYNNGGQNWDHIVLLDREVSSLQLDNPVNTVVGVFNQSFDSYQFFET